jgi:hypothetical protein
MDFPLENQQSGGGQKPPHFSKGTSMVDIDESALDEGGGLLGDGSRYVFERIRDRWTSPTRARLGWEPEVGVTHVDWDRNLAIADAGEIVRNRALVKPNVGIAVGRLSLDHDGDGDVDIVDGDQNCWGRYDGKTDLFDRRFYEWINLSSKISFGSGLAGSAAEQAACRDFIPGKYSVAKTQGKAIWDVEKTLRDFGFDSTKMSYQTFDNETDYLRKVDMSAWAHGVDGFLQNIAVSPPDITPRSLPTGYRVSDLPDWAE